MIKKWENNPWYLHKRYLCGMGYTQETYKNRIFYERILEDNDCTIEHFMNSDRETYKFSKIIIGKICSMTDWGISPFAERSVLIKKISMKYNYWDYIQAFDKVFLYENPTQSHTWFIKLMINYQDIPTWLIKWFNFYGTSPEILPELFKEYFNQWQQVKPESKDNIPENMRFFTEFSIPWIWRKIPITGYTQGLFCLKYQSYSKFWEKMIENDKDGQLRSIITINLLKEKIGSYIAWKEQVDQENKGKEIDATLDLWADKPINLQDYTEEQIKRAYEKALTRTLKMKREEDIASTSDNSMHSMHSQTSLNSLMQDAQDPFEDILIHSEDEKTAKWLNPEENPTK